MKTTRQMKRIDLNDALQVQDLVEREELLADRIREAEREVEQAGNTDIYGQTND